MWKRVGSNGARSRAIQRPSRGDRRVGVVGAVAGELPQARAVGADRVELAIVVEQPRDEEDRRAARPPERDEGVRARLLLLDDPLAGAVDRDGDDGGRPVERPRLEQLGPVR